MRHTFSTTDIPKDFASENYLPSGSDADYFQEKIQREYTKNVFNQMEDNNPHNPYTEEVRKFGYIEAGDLASLESTWTEITPTSYGVLSSNRLRNAKNHCIILIALASRAAIRGGVYYETAFSLCDSYVQSIEQCTSSIECVKLTRNAEQFFTELVQQAQKEKTINGRNVHPLVAACIDLIYTHLHDTISIAFLAGELHTHPNYLSTLFKEETGDTIHHFTQRGKIKLAENFLSYTEYSLCEIAEFLGFSSQSHLVSVFKKYTGQTPGEFRKTRE